MEAWNGPALTWRSRLSTKEQTTSTSAWLDKIVSLGVSMGGQALRTRLLAARYLDTIVYVLELNVGVSELERELGTSRQLEIIRAVRVCSRHGADRRDLVSSTAFSVEHEPSFHVCTRKATASGLVEFTRWRRWTGRSLEVTGIFVCFMNERCIG